MSQVSAQTSENLEVKEAEKTVETTTKTKIETDGDNASGEQCKVVEELVVEQSIPMAFTIIKAPKVCPPGYRLDSSGKCRRIM